MVTAADRCRRWSPLTALLAGAAATLAVQRFGLGNHLEGQPVFYFLGAAAYFLVGLGLKLLCVGTPWTAVPFVFLGIAIGAYVDANYDFYFNHIDQNLWPIGIVVWWVVGAIPLIVGFVLGGVLGRRNG